MLVSRLLYYLSSVPVLLAGVKNLPAMLTAFLRRPAQPVVIELRNGARFFVRSALDIWILKETVIEREYERASVPIQDGWTVVDIGAGLGDFSISVARRFPRCQVYAFEPLPGSFTLLEENLKLNQIRNVRAFPFSINGHEGVAEMHAPSREPAHSLTVPAARVDSSHARVRTLSLDQGIEGLESHRCDYLKVDCEGAEFEIFFNASPATLRKIQHICLEYHDWMTRNTHDDLARFFQQHGFHVTCIPSRAYRGLGLLYAARNGTGKSIDASREPAAA
jgi:FkbM family methyltransferase